MTSEIHAFLALHRIAMIGVSHDARHFSRAVYRAWRDHGYDVVAVNPAAGAVENTRCFATIREVSPAVEGAVILTPAAASGQIVEECAAAGIRRVWLYRRSPAAEDFCAAHAIGFITGECPLMYLEKMAWPHRLHRWFHDRRATA